MKHIQSSRPHKSSTGLGTDIPVAKSNTPYKKEHKHLEEMFECRGGVGKTQETRISSCAIK